MVHENADEYRQEVLLLECALEGGAHEDDDADEHGDEERCQAEAIVDVVRAPAALVAAARARVAHLTVTAKDALVAIIAGTESIVLLTIPAETRDIIPALNKIVGEVGAPPVAGPRIYVAPPVALCLLRGWTVLAGLRFQICRRRQQVLAVVAFPTFP